MKELLSFESKITAKKKAILKVHTVPVHSTGLERNFFLIQNQNIFTFVM